MYERLFAGLADDYEQGGVVHSFLHDASERPVHDALPLRLAGALHRVVLAGRADSLARHYPSTGGSPGPGLVDDFTHAMSAHEETVRLALGEQVQTNEVGRSTVLLALARWLAVRGIDRHVHLEIGASAGLNLNHMLYGGHDGRTTMGSEHSDVWFGPEWFGSPLPLPGRSAVPALVRGVDPFPVDVTDPAGELRLLSFIWPDQEERLERTRAAIRIAHDHPPHVDTASADEWLPAMLGTHSGHHTVVFHSIVWQYLGEKIHSAVRESLETAGARASKDSTVIWARMEPAGAVADIRITVWDGTVQEEHRVAEVGYHGHGLRWTEGTD
jgi:hypothetical protein